MTIDEVTENKKIYLPLLLLADEQEDMIDRYLASGRMFRLWDNGVKCIAVVTRLNETECELKNMATCPPDQGKGYGRAMLAYLAETFLKACKTMYVGTGDVPGILRFYHKSGFRESHRVKDFFTDNDDKPIIEEGVQLRDMVYLRREANDA